MGYTTGYELYGTNAEHACSRRFVETEQGLLIQVIINLCFNKTPYTY